MVEMCRLVGVYHPGGLNPSADLPISQQSAYGADQRPGDARSWATRRRPRGPLEDRPPPRLSRLQKTRRRSSCKASGQVGASTPRRCASRLYKMWSVADASRSRRRSGIHFGWAVDRGATAQVRAGRCPPTPFRRADTLGPRGASPAHRAHGRARAPLPRDNARSPRGSARWAGMHPVGVGVARSIRSAISP